MDFERTIYLKKQRDSYNRVRKEANNKQKQILESKKKNTFEEMYNNSAMETSQILKFGENLDFEYEQLTNISKNNYDRIGIPFQLIEEACKFSFKTADFEIDESNNGKKFEYFTTAKENAKNEYYRSVDKIMSFGIEIWNVEKELSNFKNRHASSLCGNTTVYKFYCKKNYYKFVVEFDDDCDCEPGILYVNAVIDERTGKEIDIRCDLYCHNTSLYQLRNFLTLLESESLEDFVNKRYRKLLQLFEYFKKVSIIVNNTDKMQLKDYNKLFQCYDYLNFRITTPRGNCIILFPYCGGTCDRIFVGPSADEYQHEMKRLSVIDGNELYQYQSITADKSERVVIGHNQFHDYKKFCQYSEFDTKTNQSIIELIDCYFDSCEGKIGYEESGIYYTDKTIVSFLTNFQQNNNNRLNYKNYSDYYNGPLIGIIVRLSSDDYYSALHFNENNESEYEYPYDSYKLTFLLKRGDADCHLVIEGKYKLLDELARKYYRSGNVDIIETDVFEPLEFSGTFTETFNYLKDFILGLQNIWRDKN